MNYKALLLMLTVGLSSNGLIAQDGEMQTREDYGLRGPVKSIETTYAIILKKNGRMEMDYGNEFNETGYTTSWSFGMSFLGLRSNGMYVRDADGKLLEEKMASGETTYLSASYSYNDKGLLTEKKSFDSDGEVTQTDTYSYNEKELVAVIETEYNDGSETTKRHYSYDSEGNLVEFIDEWDDFKEIFTYKYDKDGNRVEEHFHSTSTWEDKTQDYTIHKAYNEHGEWIELTRKDAEGKITGHETQTFDADGRQTHYHSYNHKMKLQSYTLYMDYDKHGNWTEAVTYSGKKISSTESRKILFY